MELKNVKRGRIVNTPRSLVVRDEGRSMGHQGRYRVAMRYQNELNGDDARLLVENGVMAAGEGANMPTTLEGIQAFQAAKILYCPGKASNAGGVACSGLEMSQNSLRLSWSREEVDTRLQEIMRNIHGQCVKFGTDGDYVDYVNGANLAGFVKVADAMRRTASCSHKPARVCLM